jgi:UDP-4-amino-4,6-dideoxy-N-acetyl-beta-L-altrosamine transaminase
MIPYGKHSIDDSDIASVIDVLKNQFLTQGTMVPKFEQALCDYTKAQYAVAVNSATSGLHIACLALGVGQGDLVWTVPNSFVASANCARYCGADVDFVDIDASTHNIDTAALAIKLRDASHKGRLPKVLIVVHFAGLSCDMQVIRDLTSPYAILLIEDAAHGLGGSYQGQKIGCCQYSDLCVLSFHPVKSITTAEGGAVLTNTAIYHQQCQLLAKHGTTRDPALMQGDSEGPWYYQQVLLGYNYRLSDVHAALGVSQLSKLDAFVTARQKLALRYREALANLPLRLPDEQSYHGSAWHLFMVELTQHNRADVYAELHQRGVGVNVHYIPIHLQPYYQQLGFAQGDFPVAEHFYQNALTLPLYPDLSEDQQSHVINILQEILQ